MLIKMILRCLLVGIAALTVSIPGQASMVGTAQLQANSAPVELGVPGDKRDWIRQQLILGGVDEVRAAERVAAMTEAQIAEVYQRMEDLPAGAGAGEILLVAIIVLLVLEITGYTDFIKD